MQIEPIYIVNEENYMCKTVLICGNCTQGGMFFKKSSIIPEILCSSTLLVYAAYISGQHFLRSVQQYKKKQLILSMKKIMGEKQKYFGNFTHGGKI